MKKARFGGPFLLQPRRRKSAGFVKSIYGFFQPIDLHEAWHER
ncbi:hypothetical protein [Aminobacter niigataensis]|nr:hypothetical protein [Aminobacter niigataensis]